MIHNKGVTLLSLIIMIIIMIILAAVSTSVGLNSFEKAQKARLDAERAEVVKAISARYGEYVRNKTLNPLLGDTIDEFVDNSLSGDEKYESAANKLEEAFNKEGKMYTEDEVLNHTLKNELKDLIRQSEDKMYYTRILRYQDLASFQIDHIVQNSLYVVNYYNNAVVGPIL